MYARPPSTTADVGCGAITPPKLCVVDTQPATQTAATDIQLVVVMCGLRRKRHIAAIRGRLVIADVVLPQRSIGALGITKLAGPGLAPAPHRAGVEQRAGVESTRRDRDRAAAERYVSGGARRSPGADVLVVEPGVLAVPELTAGVVPPAAHRAGIEQRARVICAGRKRDGGATERHVSSGARRLIVADRVGIAVAELAGLAGAPAADATADEQRAGMLRPGDEIGRA